MVSREAVEDVLIRARRVSVRRVRVSRIWLSRVEEIERRERIFS